jgi:hypothetical protein
MSGIATAVIGGAVVSGVVASKNASKATKAQQKGIDTATAENRRQFDQTSNNLADADEYNRAQLQLGKNRSVRSLKEGQQAQQQQLLNAQKFNAGQLKAGANRSVRALNKGQQGQEQQLLEAQKFNAGQLKAGANRAIGALRSGESKQQQQLNPFATAGVSALEQQQALLGMGGQAQQDAAFGAFRDSPGQKFMRDRAQKNLLRNSAAIGGLGGGNVRSALVEQGAGFAAQDFNNQFNRLGDIRTAGQNAAANIGQGALSTGSNAASTRFNEAQLTGAGAMNTAANVGQGMLNTGSNIASTRFNEAQLTGEGAMNTGLNIGQGMLNTANNVASNQFNAAQLSGAGTINTAARQGQFGQNLATNVGNLAVQGGNNQAQGIQNQNSIVQSGIGQLSGALGQFGNFGGSTSYGNAANSRMTGIQAQLNGIG